MLTLYSWPALCGVADNNGYGLKVFVFLKLTGVPFTGFDANDRARRDVEPPAVMYHERKRNPVHAQWARTPSTIVSAGLALLIIFRRNYLYCALKLY